MELLHKTIGIWGYGRVGQAAVDFFLAHGFTRLLVMDHDPHPTKLAHLARLGVPFVHQNTPDLFFKQCNIILPSPGIDLRPYHSWKALWLCEADLFAAYWHKPIIAITGSLGKTTVTTLIAEQLRAHGLRSAVGGNIGTPLLSLIVDQPTCDLAVIELSSFQLELCHTLVPNIAIITNVYPNHLDRHGSLSDYLQAKKNIYLHQQSSHILLAPLELQEAVHDAPSTTHFFSCTKGSSATASRSYFFDLLGNISVTSVSPSVLVAAHDIPMISFPGNWLITAAALDVLGYRLTNQALSNSTMLAHRLEYVAHHNGITFYNDSKATVMEATNAAVAAFKGKPVYLLLGGLSKGVSRAEGIKNLSGQVYHVACFGAQAALLYEYCSHAALTTSCHATLENAFTAVVEHAQPSSVILLSPGGSSYDLYKNYLERGEHFRSLVQAFVTRNSGDTPA